MRFYCKKCGSCCKNIKDVLPELDRGDGVCKNLLDNKCAIYQDRPLLCNVQKLYEAKFSHIKKGVYNKLNRDSCEMLRFLENQKKEKEPK